MQPGDTAEHMTFRLMHAQCHAVCQASQHSTSRLLCTADASYAAAGHLTYSRHSRHLVRLAWSSSLRSHALHVLRNGLLQGIAGSSSCLAPPTSNVAMLLLLHLPQRQLQCLRQCSLFFNDSVLPTGSAVQTLLKSAGVTHHHGVLHDGTQPCSCCCTPVSNGPKACDCALDRVYTVRCRLIAL